MKEMWNQRYGEPGFAYGTEPNDFLKQAHASFKPQGRVLCLAEGEGRNAVFLAEQGYDVHAVDLSDVGMDKTARLAEERGVVVHTAVADLGEYDLGTAAWDGIVSVWCHLPPPVRADVHRRVVAALAPGGVLVLEAYTPAQLELKTGGPPVAEMMMTLKALRDELAGLELEHAIELKRHVDEGKYHQGKSAVVQLIARRSA